MTYDTQTMTRQTHSENCRSHWTMLHNRNTPHKWNTKSQTDNALKTDHPPLSLTITKFIAQHIFNVFELTYYHFCPLNNKNTIISHCYLFFKVYHVNDILNATFIHHCDIIHLSLSLLSYLLFTSYSFLIKIILWFVVNLLFWKSK